MTPTQCPECLHSPGLYGPKTCDCECHIPITLEYEYVPTQEEVRNHIRRCEGNHVQQAVYSTFHDALTQVCYGCLKVRSTIRR